MKKKKWLILALFMTVILPVCAFGAPYVMEALFWKIGGRSGSSRSPGGTFRPDYLYGANSHSSFYPDRVFHDGVDRCSTGSQVSGKE